MAIPTRAEARALLADLIPNYYLIENRRRIRNEQGGQFNDTRRPAPWGRGPIPQGVLHSYEAPHTRSLIAAAEYIVIRTTPGGYHFLAGDDDPRDVLPMAPVVAETWHCIPSNPWAIGGSCVMYAHTWRTLPVRSRDNLVKSLAYGFYLASLELIALGKAPIPAKRITRAEAMRGVWGFVDHMGMDPGRRSDIGTGFPWDDFFTEYTRLLGGTTTVTAQEDDMGHVDTISDDAAEKIARALAEFNNAGRGKQKGKDTDKRGIFTLVHDIADDLQKTKAQVGADAPVVREIAKKVGAPVDARELARALAPSLIDPLVAAVSASGTLTRDDVEEALRGVFADAANPTQEA